MAVLLDNTRQARKVRRVMAGMVVWCVAMTAWGAWLAQTYGLSPGDGGVLKSLPTRLTVALAITAIGLAPLAAMLVYARVYLVRLETAGERIELTVLGWRRPARHVIDRVQVSETRYSAGKLHNASGVSVDAPWISIRLRDRRLPFIADMQAEVADRRALLSLSAPYGPPTRRSRKIASARGGR